MKSRFLLFFLICGLTGISYAEKFDLEVYASKFDSIPVGILDFKASSGVQLTENEPWKVIANDLDFCGRFQVVRAKEFDSAAFAEANVGLYIDGQYMVEGNTVTIDCYLRDVVNRELIIGKKYKGEKKALRGMAHRYSNEIVAMLFGDKGIFESRILYVKVTGNRKNIAMMDFDGFSRGNITNNDVINLFPTFADQNTVIWTSYLRGKPDLYKGSILDGSSKIFIYSRAVESSPDVSPVDGTVAYASSKNGNLDIYTCNPDGTNVKQLTAHYGVDTSPSWSPNGYQIAFTSDRSGNPHIYVMDAEGGNQRRLTFEGKYADSPAWSPKGDKIAFQMMGENGSFDIYTIAPDGSNLTKVTNIPGNNEYPIWAPDGSLIAFVNTAGGRSDLFVVKHDGSRARRVTSSGDVRMPDWSDF